MPTVECPKCKGTGGIPDGSILGAIVYGFKGRKCDLCNGTGYIKDNVVLEIRHQPGSVDHSSNVDYEPSTHFRQWEEERRRLDKSTEEMYEKIAKLQAIKKRKLSAYNLAMDTGEEFYDLGKYAQAVDCFKEAASIELSPCEISYAWNRVGFCLDKLGRYAEAITAYDNSIEQGCPSFLTTPWWNKGIALEALGRYSEAEIAFAKSKKLDEAYPRR